MLWWFQRFTGSLKIFWNHFESWECFQNALTPWNNGFEQIQYSQWLYSTFLEIRFESSSNCTKGDVELQKSLVLAQEGWKQHSRPTYMCLLCTLWSIPSHAWDAQKGVSYWNNMFRILEWVRKVWIRVLYSVLSKMHSATFSIWMTPKGLTRLKISRKHSKWFWWKTNLKQSLQGLGVQ